MTPRHLTLPTALLALTCLTLPVTAAPAPPPPHPSTLRSDILYTHRGEFVQVSPMRALTLNAHVEQFAYDPLGLEIAVVGSEVQGDQTAHFVKTLDARTGHEISRLTVTSPPDDPAFRLFLLGWSASGRYILLQKIMSNPQNPDRPMTEYLRWDLISNSPTIQTLHPEAFLPDGVASYSIPFYNPVSPDRHWLVFEEFYSLPSADGTESQKRNHLLYDVEKDSFRSLDLPDETDAGSWFGNGQLKISKDHILKQYNVLTNQMSPSPDTPPVAVPAASNVYPDLTLDTEQRTLSDSKGTEGSVNSCIVWIRRIPFGKMPLGVAAAGLMPIPQTDKYPGSDDSQAAWSPTGKQVAFVANNVLYVTNLIPSTDLLPNEKLAVGLRLSCAEEQALAQSNMKQIGVALTQYVVDNFFHYPPAAGIEDALAPYLQTRDVFSVGKNRWVYHGASGALLGSIDTPAETVQATMDLPCANVVLFFDGHVKVFPK